jgi:hypothetical protein
VLLNYKDNHTVIASKYFSEIFFDRTMEMYTAVNGYFSERLSTTLEKQHECITNIGKMHSNFKKDSKLRKTKKYLINKLELLESAGKECVRRHTVVSAIATKTETYFTENAFSNIQKVYAEYRSQIQALLEERGANQDDDDDDDEMEALKQQLEELKAQLNQQENQQQQQRIRKQEVKMQKKKYISQRK